MHAKGNEWTVGPTSAPDLPNFGDAGGVAHADSHSGDSAGDCGEN